MAVAWTGVIKEAFRALDRGHGRRRVIANNAGAFRLGVEAAQDSRNWCRRPPA